MNPSDRVQFLVALIGGSKDAFSEIRKRPFNETDYLETAFLEFLGSQKAVNADQANQHDGEGTSCLARVLFRCTFDGLTD